MTDTATFEGFPVAALDFYDDLEMDNTKSFWTAHKDTYDTAVKAPMAALTAALEPEFGPAKVFRPYRDVRFSADKRAYKDRQGAFVPCTKRYQSMSPRWPRRQPRTNRTGTTGRATFSVST